MARGDPRKRDRAPVAVASSSKGRRLRELLTGVGPLVSPGIFDAYSARLVEAMGFQTAATTGAGLTNSLLGQPDIGILGLRDNVDACRHIARSVSIPVMADADTGYGNAVSVHYTVEYFEEAGVAGINLEDQVMPKRCGHMRGKELVSPQEMAGKIEAAVKARRDPDFVINARTDAIAVEGIEGAIERLRIYVAAGADMVYPDAVRGEDDVRRVVDAFPDVPVSINIGFGIRSRPTTPPLALGLLRELGVARASVPRLLSAAAISGMTRALEVMKECMVSGETVDRPDLLASMEEITGLFDYEKVASLESEFLDDADLLRKYGAGSRSYVVRSGETQR